MSTYSDYYGDKIWPPTVKEEPKMTKEEKVIGVIAKGPGMSPNEYQRYQGHKVDPEHLEKSSAIAEACTAMDWNMEDVMQANIEKLKARYPDGFNAEHSLHRKAGDI